MNMNQEQQPRGYFDDAKTAMSWLMFLVQTLATSVQPFLNGRFGSRYFGLQALAVLVLIPLYSLLWEGHDVRPLMVFLGTYLVMCAVARTGVLVRYFRRDYEHSYYGGYPRIMRFCGRMKETTVKGCIEPIIVFITGAVLWHYSEPLGGYLMLAAFGLFGSVHLALGYERTRALDMNDAMIDQHNVTECFRDMRGDRF